MSPGSRTSLFTTKKRVGIASLGSSLRRRGFREEAANAAARFWRALSFAFLALVVASCQDGLTTPDSFPSGPSFSLDPSQCTLSVLTVVAHEDDDLIFISPDLLQSIRYGACVRTVYLTAGDGGTPYWLNREAGMRASYAEMAGVPNNWTESDAGVSGHPIKVFTLNGNQRVSLVFLRLPDGGGIGEGYESTGFTSLQKLWENEISTISAIDSTSTYTRAELISTLATLIAEYQPDKIRTQDYLAQFDGSDHSDHVTAARLTHAAHQTYTQPHTFAGYMGYPNQNHPYNIADHWLDQKWNAFMQYAAFDGGICAPRASCAGTGYDEWMGRQIIVGTDNVGTAANHAPLASAGEGTSVVIGGSVQLDGSFSFDPDGQAITYSWQQVSGASVVLNNANTATPTFTAPDVPGNVTFQLTVSDGQAVSAPDAVTVRVTATQEINVAPYATATATSEDFSNGATAPKAIDGVVGGYPGDSTKEWTAVGGGVGSALTLTWPTPVTLSKVILYDRINVADQVTGGTLTFSDGSVITVGALPNDGYPLTVNFEPRATTSLVFTATSVSVSTSNVGLAEIEAWGVAGGTLNRQPVANAGPNQQVELEATVQLDGSASSDPDENALTYAWTQLSGPSVTLSNASAAAPTFTAPSTSTVLTFALVVNDGVADSPADTVEVIVGTPPTNLAPLGTAMATSESGVQTAAKAIDGVIDGYPGDYTREWATAGGGPGSTLTITWDSPVTLSRVTLFDRPNPGDQVTAGLLMFSDGSVYPVGTLPNDGSAHVVDFPERATMSVAFTVTAVSGSTVSVGLAELQAWGVAGGYVNQAPIANAGSDQQVPVGGAVELDGSASTDPEESSITYSWTQIAGPNVTLSSTTAARPTFTAPSSVTVVSFRLVVHDGLVPSKPDTVNIIVGNPPTNLAPQATVSASSQSSGQEAVKAIDGVIDGYPGDYSREWASSNDGVGTTLTLTWASPVTLSSVVLYDRPNAADQVTAGTLTFSDGSVVPVGALPNDGSGLVVEFPERSTLTLVFRVTAVAGGTLNVGLAEIEAWGEPGGSVNNQPIANAGPNQQVQLGAAVQLNGSNSADPDGSPITYSWTQVGGPSVSLSNASTAQPTFTAPSAGALAPSSYAVLTFRLVVHDGLVPSLPDTVQITVGTPPSNVAPLATAVGSSQAASQVAANAIDGVADGYPGDYTREWATVGGREGSTLTLTWSTQVHLSRVVLHDRPNLADQVLGGTLTFDDGSVVVVGTLPNDGAPLVVDFSERETSSVVFTITSVSGSTGNVGLAEFEAWGRTGGPLNGKPIANAGADQQVQLGATVQLNGLASSDPEGSPITYSWTQIGGPSVTLSNASSAQPTFTAPSAGAIAPSTSAVLAFRLVVHDGLVQSAPDTVLVAVGTPPSNVARLATAVGSSEAPSQGAANTIDGIADGYPGNYTREWATVGGGAGSTLTLSWSTPVSLSRVVIYDRPNLADQVLGGTLTFSDGSVVSVGALPNDGAPLVVDFSEREATSVLFTISSVSGSTGNVGLAELEAWGIVVTP